MIFHMFKGITAKIFISTHMVTTLIFPQSVEKVVAGWNKGEVFKYQSKDRKVLVLRANRKDVNSNMTIITKSGIYDFDISVDNISPHKGSIEVKNGRPSSTFALYRETSEYRAFEGDSTLLIAPKKKINLNGSYITTQSIVPKGPPVFINSKREIY